MESQNLLSFFKLDPQHVLDDVDKALAQLGQSRCTGRMIALNSLENRVYLAELEDGEQIVVKFYRPGRWTRAQILEEHSFLASLAENEIPVVAPMRWHEAGLTLFSTSSNNGSIALAVFPKVRGRLTDELSFRQAEILGRYIGRMHMIFGSRRLEHRPALGVNTFGDDALDDLERSGLICSPSGARYIQSAELVLDLIDPILALASGSQCESTQPVHGDCHVGNVLWNGESPFLLDFDDMTSCLRVQDLWLISPGRDTGSLQTRDAFIRGYEQFSHFDDAELRCVEPLRALRMIHYTAWIAKRWADPLFPRTFPNFGSDSYWQDETVALQEIAEMISSIG